MLAALELLQIPARSWRVANPLRVILRVVATMYAGFTTVFVALIKSGFLDYAETGWLTLLARYVYGVERVTADFATGEVTLTNSGGGIYPFAAGELRLQDPTTLKRVRERRRRSQSTAATPSRRPSSLSRRVPRRRRSPAVSRRARDDVPRRHVLERGRDRRRRRSNGRIFAPRVSCARRRALRSRAPHVLRLRDPHGEAHRRKRGRHQPRSDLPGVQARGS